MISGNTSSEDLDKFSERFIGQDEEEDEEEEEVTGGRREEWTVTTVTTRQSTELGSVDVSNTASLPVSMVS